MTVTVDTLDFDVTLAPANVGTIGYRSDEYQLESVKINGNELIDVLSKDVLSAIFNKAIKEAEK